MIIKIIAVVAAIAFLVSMLNLLLLMIESSASLTYKNRHIIEIIYNVSAYILTFLLVAIMGIAVVTFVAYAFKS